MRSPFCNPNFPATSPISHPLFPVYFLLEAFAAGVSVLGTNIGGIAESVSNGVDGLLIEPDSVQGWCQAILRCVEEPALLAQLRDGIRPPRSMDAVAQEMRTAYEQLLRKSPAPGNEFPGYSQDAPSGASARRRGRGEQPQRGC